MWHRPTRTATAKPAVVAAIAAAQTAWLLAQWRLCGGGTASAALGLCSCIGCNFSTPWRWPHHTTCDSYRQYHAASTPAEAAAPGCPQSRAACGTPAQSPTAKCILYMHACYHRHFAAARSSLKLPPSDVIENCVPCVVLHVRVHNPMMAACVGKRCCFGRCWLCLRY